MKQNYLILLGVFVYTLSSCRHDKPLLFQKISSFHSGIHFNNVITENDSINPIDNAYIYNGGGVGVGDFNNDGLPDLYFTGNMVSNKLYLNKGDFKFEDITEKAGVGGMGRWGRGIAVIDINNDGLLDLYVCNSLLKDSLSRANLLYINTGIDNDGMPHFKEEAHEYGLDLHAHSTMASFFDFDNDGRLDMYLTVNEPNPSFYANNFRPIIKDGSSPSTGRLYKNVWDARLGHPVFKDVSRQAGILIEGYGHAASIVDINRDGWKDIYVTNDFLSANILYINNHDGTFTDRSKEYFKHTSFNAMGQDIEDINNDGLADVFELDMAPEDNYRKKMMMMPTSYQSFQLIEHYGYQYQYARNTLQINQGPRVGQNDSIGSPAFSEIGFLSGVAQTDWSWTPMIADFDNNSYRDLIVTNGYPKDVTDHDFITFRDNPYSTASKKKLIEQLPAVKLHNYGFKNNGDLTFSNVTANWGLDIPTFSNGAAYADLNNDGSLDLIINNINDEALIYKNTARSLHKDASHFLQIKFAGDANNKNGIGAWADIYYDHGKHQVYENSPYRGYLSSIQNIAHFGLGKTTQLDSVIIRWPNNKKQTLTGVKADQVLSANVLNAHDIYSWEKPVKNTQGLFREITKAAGVHYKHQEDDFVDFNIQKLLPHKLSEYSPALAVGDVDGNGLDDIVVGGSSRYPAQLLLQQANGKFVQRNLLPPATTKTGNITDEGILLFDADGDGKLDLYIASGGFENEAGSSAYLDRLYLNDGKGNFKLAAGALPPNFTSKLCVRAVDYNKDGKLDLFISGRVEPWGYPKPVSSAILRNDSYKGHLKFTDVTNEVAPALKNIGLVCDALFTDYNNDGWPDLVIAGEWMPVTFLKNNRGKYINETASTGLSNKVGWWNSIIAGDFRHTGRMDYIVGNVGQNTLYQVSDQYPAYITAGDFDKRGRLDAFPSLYLPGTDGRKNEYPAFVRDDAVKQLISLRKKFTNYKSYATATLQDLLTPAQLKGAIRLKANTQQSCYLRNDGNGKFTMFPLPKEAQVSALNGMAVDDYDHDGNLDVMINGNDYGTDVSIGRYDALNGLVLKGDGKGNFTPLSILKSGIYIPGNGKALVKLHGNSGKYLLAASQHNDVLKLFELKSKSRTFTPGSSDQSALIHYANGTSLKQEFYYGSSFLSQSARFINVEKDVSAITIFRNDGTSYEAKLK
ncbi:VCBS repeat-containing protein [Mucilaginibacter paludis]|uniref:ASPIC/UnbV domain protein n=1 Tax=Mucilaginibacter paludis DSM 18603 TaxID=714943 RepID=H1Y295_9SPHI|nr:VCBS repeat-containing protein [Mucilaginibacter paludis]EHQ27875.1 ASPIC/UnbV domain protein [Mucilaginibacter paludis DSM 18603]